MIGFTVEDRDGTVGTVDCSISSKKFQLPARPSRNRISPPSLGGSFLSRNSLFAKRAVRVVCESHVLHVRGCSPSHRLNTNVSCTLAMFDIKQRRCLATAETLVDV